jgi:hypothetical protein
MSKQTPTTSWVEPQADQPAAGVADAERQTRRDSRRPPDDPATPSVPDEEHRRPDGASDAVVEAVGKVSEAWEWVERMRGRLYDLHQMAGHADLLFGDAAGALREAGCVEAAEAIEREVVGRNVLDGRWTFQMVEEFDDQYYEPVRALERRLRDELMEGRRHVFEAQLKEQRRSRGHPAHTSRPAPDRGARGARGGSSG